MNKQITSNSTRLMKPEVQLDMFGSIQVDAKPVIKRKKKPSSLKSFISSASKTLGKNEERIRHKVDNALPSWQLLMDPDYDSDTHEFSLLWSSEAVLTFFCNMLEWSLMRVNLILKKGEPLAKNTGPYRELSADLKEELNWYETDQFDLISRCCGYDPAEIRAYVRDELSERLHGNDEATEQLLESDQGILHLCESSRSWFEFLDHNYNRKHRGIVCSWTGRNIATLYTKMLNSTLHKIDRIVCENKATILNRNETRIINPELQDEMDWVKTKLFSAIAKKNGYNPGLLVKHLTAMVIVQVESELID